MISRRHFYTSNSDSKRQFTHYRSGKEPGVELPGLFMYAFDSFLIYDSSRVFFKFFVDNLSYIDQAMFNDYFRDCDLSSLNVKDFDRNASYFFSYFSEMSKHFYNKVAYIQDYSQYWVAMLNYWSDVFKIPILASIFDMKITIDSEGLIDWFPLQVCFSHEGIRLKYPSITHFEELRASRKLPTCDRCGTKNKENAYCDKSCCICKDCWQAYSLSSKKLVCPKCSETTSRILQEELKTRFGIKIYEMCRKCKKEKEHITKCQRGCSICKECWVEEYEKYFTLSCPKCYFRLDSTIYNEIKSKYVTKTNSVYKKCRNCNMDRNDFSSCQNGCDICEWCWKQKYESLSIVYCPACKNTLETKYYTDIKHKFNIRHQGYEHMMQPVQRIPKCYTCGNGQELLIRCDKGCDICTNCWGKEFKRYDLIAYCPKCSMILSKETFLEIRQKMINIVNKTKNTCFKCKNISINIETCDRIHNICQDCWEKEAMKGIFINCPVCLKSISREKLNTLRTRFNITPRSIFQINSRRCKICPIEFDSSIIKCCVCENCWKKQGKLTFDLNKCIGCGYLLKEYQKKEIESIIKTANTPFYPQVSLSYAEMISNETQMNRRTCMECRAEIDEKSKQYCDCYLFCSYCLEDKIRNEKLTSCKYCKNEFKNLRENEVLEEEKKEKDEHKNVSTEKNQPQEVFNSEVPNRKCEHCLQSQKVFRLYKDGHAICLQCTPQITTYSDDSSCPVCYKKSFELLDEQSTHITPQRTLNIQRRCKKCDKIQVEHLICCECLSCWEKELKTAEFISNCISCNKELDNQSKSQLNNHLNIINPACSSPSNTQFGTSSENDTKIYDKSEYEETFETDSANYNKNQQYINFKSWEKESKDFFKSFEDSNKRKNSESKRWIFAPNLPDLRNYSSNNEKFNVCDRNEHPGLSKSHSQVLSKIESKCEEGINTETNCEIKYCEKCRTFLDDESSSFCDCARICSLCIKKALEENPELSACIACSRTLKITKWTSLPVEKEIASQQSMPDLNEIGNIAQAGNYSPKNIQYSEFNQSENLDKIPAQKQESIHYSERTQFDQRPEGPGDIPSLEIAHRFPNIEDNKFNSRSSLTESSKCPGCKKNFNESLCLSKCFCLDCGKQKFRLEGASCKICKEPYPPASLMNYLGGMLKTATRCNKCGSNYPIIMIFNVFCDSQELWCSSCIRNTFSHENLYAKCGNKNHIGRVESKYEPINKGSSLPDCCRNSSPNSYKLCPKNHIIHENHTICPVCGV